MNVLALTILVSSCLAGIFIACFVIEIRRARRTSPERDSLLPLDLDSETHSQTRILRSATPTLSNPIPTKHP